MEKDAGPLAGAAPAPSAESGDASSPEQPASPGYVAVLGAAGVALILVACFWNRIALGGPYGQADAWVADLARPIGFAFESLFGPLEVDPEGLPQVHRIAQLLGSWVIATFAYFAGVWLVLRRPERLGRAGPEIITAVAVLCHIVPLFSPPILETDPCRYLWDGATVVAGINPYRYAPVEAFGYKIGKVSATGREAAELATLAALVDHPRLNWHFHNINHPAVPTLYPPLAQALFSVAHRIGPGNVLVVKALVALIDLALLALVAALLDLVGQPRCRMLIYGWCPLVLKEYAQTGHYDPVATACLLGALYLALRGRRTFAGVYLGLAALGKLYPLVVAPVLARRLGWRGAAACAVTIALAWAPYLDIGLAAFEGLRVYNREWMMNGSVFPVVRAALGSGDVLKSMELTRLILGALYVLLLAALARQTDSDARDLLSRAFTAVGALFLIAPVCNPWYAAWVLPFAALSGRVSWIVLSATMGAYYAYFTLHAWTLAVPGVPWSVDLRLLEYGPFYLLLAVEVLTSLSARTAPEPGTSRPPAA